MDKPRHPLVVQPWKIQQSQRGKWNAPPVKTGKERGRLGSEKLKTPTPKKTRGEGSRRRSEIEAFKNDRSVSAAILTTALEFF